MVKIRYKAACKKNKPQRIKSKQKEGFCFLGYFVVNKFRFTPPFSNYFHISNRVILTIILLILKFSLSQNSGYNL